MKRLSFILLLLSLFIGCKKDDPVSPPPTPSMSGRWSGAASGLIVTLTLSQSGNDVIGSGLISGTTTSIAVEVTGTNVYPNVSLTFYATGYYPMNFTGKFSDNNTIPGKFNGSGFSDFSITLIRQ
jgi:hypothetical protein